MLGLCLQLYPQCSEKEKIFEKIIADKVFDSSKYEKYLVKHGVDRKLGKFKEYDFDDDKNVDLVAYFNIFQKKSYAVMMTRDNGKINILFDIDEDGILETRFR